MVGFADALEIHDFSKVGIRLVGNMDEVGLDQRFWWRWADLKSLKKRIDLRHALIDTFDETV